MRRLILGAVSMSFALSTAMAGPREDAEAAYFGGDRATTLRILRGQAGQETRRIQSMLGTLFPPCRDVGADYADVVALFRADADRGDSRAQFNLGNAYFFGNGVPRDYTEAVMWYRLAAEQGEAGALHNLGYMYEQGVGVPHDSVQAHVLFNLATSRYASFEYRDAAADRVTAARSLDVVAAKMTSTELAKAQDLALRWTPAGQQIE